jgi:MFS family permease
LDIASLFATRSLRMFAYGLLGVVLVLYLSALGFSNGEIGLLLTLTLAGDTLVSLMITTQADRIGRKRMLMMGAGLMCIAGILFAITDNFILLLIAATLGVISPSGSEVGPFLPIEQSALAQRLEASAHTRVFAWYQLAGSLSTALGALAAGTLAEFLQQGGALPIESFRVILFLYAGLGFILLGIFSQVSKEIEVKTVHKETEWSRLGLGTSRATVLKLAGLFSLDAFGGGLIVQSLMAYWFYLRFGVNLALLGSIFFGANILAGFSALSAAWIAKRVGLLNTMVFTHLPSNILLALIPFMPSLPWAAGLLLVRFSISQMDVPTRQAYVFSVVAEDERSGAAGITGIARTLGASLAPLLSARLFSLPLLAGGVPFVVAGGLKIIYDLVLFFNFKGNQGQ